MARQDNGVWVASCLDLDLAAQGDTLEEAKASLEAMIAEYVFDAVAGEDRAYAGQLLRRKAPLGEWITYYFIKAFNRVHGAKDGLRRALFTEAMPLAPCDR
jgi:hypothetical protein